MKNICNALLALFLSPLVLASELVVLESTSPEYQDGDILDAETQIVLADDGRLRLIAEDGTIISLTGPFVGIPNADESQGDSGVLDALGRLVGSAESEAVDIGGVRGDEARDELLAQAVPDTRSSPWLLHTEITGPQCVVANADEVRYWRENSSTDEELHVKHIASGDIVAVAWNAGENTVAWPDDMPVLADEMYLLRLGNQLRSTTLLVREIPSAVSDEGTAMVAFLAANGCISQARMQYSQLL